MSEGRHLTNDGMDEILYLKAGMNSKRTFNAGTL
jgi:hypothetical protein